MADARKARERHYLEQFQAARPDLIQGSLKDSESPDFFFVGRDGLRIGIEVTRLFHSEPRAGDPEQARVARANRIVQRARARYEESGAMPLVVDVLFERSFELTRRDESSLVDSVLHIVSRNLPAPGERKEEERGWENRGYFHEPIHSVCVLRLDPPLGYWTAGYGGIYLPDLLVARLESKIRKKAAKIHDYRDKCDRIWLVMVTDLGLSSMWTVDQSVVSSASSCGFDRAFILTSGRVYECTSSQVPTLPDTRSLR